VCRACLARRGRRSIVLWVAADVACPGVAGRRFYCAHGDGIGAFITDPAMYDGYNCKQLAAQRDGLTTRQKQLRNLIDKADQGGGGTVIGALAYRSDYQKVLEQEKLLQRAEASRKCQVALPATTASPQAPVTMSAPGPAAPAAVSTYASDHTIH
jgi:hypothetical protein